MAAVMGHLVCAGLVCSRSVNPCTAAAFLFDSRAVVAPPEQAKTMLKIVPDPPHLLHSLEDALMQAADYALCAEAVAQQAMLMQPRSPVSALIMTSMHELDALHKLLEAALVEIQKPTETRTQH